MGRDNVPLQIDLHVHIEVELHAKPVTLLALWSTSWYWTVLSTCSGVLPTAAADTVAYCIPCGAEIKSSCYYLTCLNIM